VKTMQQEIREILWLTWKNEEGESFRVGELHRRSGKYYFKYEINEVKRAEKCGFELLKFLPIADSEYFREELFRTFMERIPSKSQKGIDELLKKYDIGEYDEFELLKKTGGKSDTDRFEFIEPIAE
jgi:hypothetical protein